jgi:hypothetical protein
MKRIFREHISRLAMAGLLLMLGVGLCWRALDYSNPLDASMLAPLLCVILGVVLGLTGVTVAMRGGELDQNPEPTPARQN